MAGGVVTSAALRGQQLIPGARAPDVGQGFPLTSDVSANGFRIEDLGAPVLPGDAANKGYVDTSIATAGAAFLRRDGTTTLLGAWVVGGVFTITDLPAPSAASDAATKAYVDSSIASGAFVKRDGTTTLTGAWNVGAQRITGLAAPAAATDAARQGDVVLRDGTQGLTATWNVGAQRITGLAAPAAATDAARQGDVVLRDGTQTLTADWAVGGHKLTGLTDPTLAQDAATKNYVDTTIATGAFVKRDGSTTLTATWDVGTQRITGLAAPAAATDAARQGDVVLRSGTQNLTGTWDVGTQRITGLAAPVAATDAARDGDVVHNTGTENVGGAKTFTSAATFSAGLTCVVDDATTNAVTVVETLRHTTSGTAANNIGTAELFQAENTVGGTESVAQVEAILTNATSATAAGALFFQTRTGGAALQRNMMLTPTGGLAVGLSATGFATDNGQGTITIPNNKFVNARNQADSSFINLLGSNTSNNVVLGGSTSVACVVTCGNFSVGTGAASSITLNHGTGTLILQQGGSTYGGNVSTSVFKWGTGDASGTPGSFTHRGAGATGTDTVGGALTIAAGLGTGAAASSTVTITAPVPVGTGTTAQAAANVAQWTYPGTSLNTGEKVAVNRSGTVTLDQVSVGATDSGGTGFRVLRVPN